MLPDRSARRGVCVAPPPPPPAPAETPPARPHLPPPPPLRLQLHPLAHHRRRRRPTRHRNPAHHPQQAAPRLLPPLPPQSALWLRRRGARRVHRHGQRERDTKCAGSDCPSIRTEDYDDKSGLVLGADFFGHLSPQFRLGGGLLFAPNTKMETSDGSAKVGSDLSLLAIGEGVFDVGPTTALALRLFVGPAIVIAGSDLKDENDSINDSCNRSTASSTRGRTLH
ncbi:MAG: hypothetical protein IPI67_00135 [Myxococcales bacterium]|nr:hypothetical protein [Myxococcales bacterium]